jgi:hypothetical protein
MPKIITLPRVIVSKFSMACIIDDVTSSIDTMDVVREILVNIDCNPSWYSGRRNSYDEWVSYISEKATKGINLHNSIRARYGSRKDYSGTVIDNTVTHAVIKWLNEAHHIEVYNYDRVENVPRCLSCGAPHELMWNKIQYNKTGNQYRLIWGCPNYREGCSNLKRLFKRLSPEIVHLDGIHKVFFHDYERDGITIPPSSIRTPVTEWTLARNGYLQTIVEASRGTPGSDASSAVPATESHDVQLPVTSRLSSVHTEFLKRWYSSKGPGYFFESFPDERQFSWNDILEAANLLGL